MNDYLTEKEQAYFYATMNPKTLLAYFKLLGNTEEEALQKIKELRIKAGIESE